MQMKEYYVNKFMMFKSEDKENLGELIKGLETYISDSKYDAQLDLILHGFKILEVEYKANNFDDCCKVSAPIFELLKTMDWGWLELQVLSCAIGNIQNYKNGVELMEKAFGILDKDFAGHKSYEVTKFRYNINFSLRLLRAKYYDNPDPEEIQAEFDQCINAALAACEKLRFGTFKLVLLVRKALFYGEADDVVAHVHELEKTRDKVWIATTKDEVVEYFQALGDNLNNDLKNLAIGHQIRKRRKELGLKVKDLAVAVGTATSVVYEFESGARGVSNTRLCSVAQTLKAELAYFFGGSDKKVPGAVTDVAAHKVVQLMSNMSEPQKEYIVAFIRDFIQFNEAKESQQS